MIAFLIIPLIIIYLLRNQAAKCFAQREKCMNRASFNASVLSDLDYHWYYPSFDLIAGFKGSSFLKDEYPNNKAEWQRLASNHLPTWIYKLVNRFRPQWDPFSDFVHYMKTKEEFNNWSAVMVALSGILLCDGFWIYAGYSAACCIAWGGGYNFNFNRHLKELTK